MFNPFAHSEINLGRAGWLLLLVILGGVASSLVLGQFGLPAELVVLGAWSANLAVAWYLAKPARALGKRALLYGLFSALGPPASIISSASLHS